MSLSLINIDTTNNERWKDHVFDFVTRLSYLAARPSLEPRPLQVFIFFFFFFLRDRPTHHHKRQGDGKRNILLGWPY